MGSNLVSINVSADISSATAKLELLGKEFKSATAEIAQAAQRVFEAEKMVQNAIASGHTALAQGIASVAAKERAEFEQMIANRSRLKAAMDEVKATTVAEKEALESEHAAIREQQAAMKAAAESRDALVAGSLRSFTQAIEQEGEAMSHTVSSTAAASGAVRELEGHIPIRAVERFAAQTLGLGPILQSAFPLIGAIALTGVIVKMAEEVYHAAQNFLYLKGAEEEVIKVGEQMARESESDLEQIGHLGIAALREQGKLVAAAQEEMQLAASKPIHLPKLDDKKLKELDTSQFHDQFQKLKDAYSEVIPAEIPDRIRQINKNIEDLQGEVNRVNQTGHSAFDVFDTHYLAQDKVAIEAYQELLQRLQVSEQRYAAEQGKNQADIAKAQKEEQRKRDEAARKAEEAAHRRSAIAESELQSQVARLESQARVATATADADIAAASRAAEAKTEIIKNPHERAIAVAHAEVDAARQKAAAIEAIDKRTLEQELAILEQRRAIAAADPRGQEKVSSVDTEMEGKKAEYVEKQIRAREALAAAEANLAKTQLQAQREIEDQGEKMAEKAISDSIRYMQEQTKTDLELNRMREDAAAKHETEMLKIREVGYQADVLVGKRDKGDLLALKQQQYDEEYRITLAAIERERQALKSAYSPDSNDYKKGVAQLDQKKQSATDTHDLNTANVQLQQMQQTVGKIRSALDPLGRAFESAVGQMITGGGRFDVVMAQAARNMLASWAEMLVKMGVEWAERHAVMLALHEAWQLGITATDYSQQAARTAATKVTDVANTTDQITSAAGVAAANTFASISAIPIIGPEIAPAAAAASFAEVMSFNVVSAERGAVLPNSNSLAFLHPNEMVLPANLSRGIQNFFGGGSTSSTSRSSTVNVGAMNYNAKSSLGSKEFMATAKSAMRNMNA